MLMLVYNLNDTFLVLLKLYGKLITNFVEWVVKSPACRIENIYLGSKKYDAIVIMLNVAAPFLCF
jgi:hypothetical protein